MRCKAGQQQGRHSSMGATGGAGGAPKLGKKAEMNASAAEMSLASAGCMIRAGLSFIVAGWAANGQARRCAPGLIVLRHKPGVVQPVGGRACVRLELEPHGAAQRGVKAPAEQQRPAVQHLCGCAKRSNEVAGASTQVLGATQGQAPYVWLAQDTAIHQHSQSNKVKVHRGLTHGGGAGRGVQAGAPPRISGQPATQRDQIGRPRRGCRPAGPSRASWGP